MEPVTQIPIPAPTKLSAEAKQEYGEPLSKAIIKYVGYAFIVIVALALVCWPFFSGMK